MDKRYGMKDLGMDALVGREVTSAEINESNDLVVLHTTTGKLFLTWEGDCCAQCFLAHIGGAENLLGAPILSVESTAWTGRDDKDDYGCVTETMGTTIRTSKGHITFETRVEHNGYYGGFILVSDEEPMDQYYSPRYDDGTDPSELVLKPLTDF